MNGDGVFRYHLEALRQLRDWELEAERVALADATRAVALAEAKRDDLEVRFAAARSHAARRAADPATFSVHWQRVAADYFGALLAAIESATVELERSRARRAQVMERVLQASVAFSAVDRHRAEARMEFEREAARRELARADERWVQRLTMESAR